jgi:hypothetical protein
MVNRNSYLSLLESVNEAVVGAPTKAPAKVTKSPTKANTTATKVANTVAKGTPGGSGIQWGDPSIGGAKNGAELAAWLNKQSGGSAKPSVPTNGGVADAQAASVSKVAQVASTIGGTSRPGTTAIAPKGKVSKASMTNTTMAEEWDEVDEILAEALEVFGEEDLVAILENFEETGELPQEFIDIIDSING